MVCHPQYSKSDMAKVIVDYYPLTEGILDYGFIKNLFDSYNTFQQKVEFKINPNAPANGCKNDDGVLNQLDKVVKWQFYNNLQSQYLVEKHLFIVVAGIDEDGKGYASRMNKLRNKIKHDKFIEHCVFFVSVRQIETWIYYLLQPKKNRSELDIIPIDAIERRLKIQGNAAEKASQFLRKLKEVNGFSQPSIQRLVEQSASFADFLKCIDNYTENLHLNK
jgi:hypothetical protein